MEHYADRLALKESIWFGIMRTCLLFCLAAGTLAEGQDRSSLFEKYGGWTIAVILVALAANSIRRTIDRSDVFIVDANGCFDKRAMDRPIPWSEVTAISEWRSLRGSGISIHVKEARRFTTGLRWIVSGWHYDRVSITGGLSVRLPGVKAAMDHFYRVSAASR